MPYIGRDLNRGNYLKLDDISSSFNSSTKTFNLTVGGSAFTPGSAFSILVSVGGVIQEPESAYQVNNSEITFANAPTAQDSFFCIALGVALGIGVPGNGTVNGTQMAKPFNYDGYFHLDDTNNRVGINSSSPTVALDVIGNIKLNGNLVTGSGAGGLQGNVYAASGISTFNDVLVNGNLTVEGDTTTLNTTLRNVELLRVSAASTLPAGIITQTSTGDILRLYDSSTQVFTVADGGAVTLSSTIDVTGQSTFRDRLQIVDTTPEILLSKPSGGLDSRILNDGSGNLIIGTGENSDTPGEKFRIKSTGEVGIGTNNPSQLLSLSSTSPRILLTHATSPASNCFIDYAASGVLELSIDDNNVSANSKLQVRMDGAAAKLTIDANGVVQVTKGTSGGATANTDAALILDNNSHTYVQFRTPDSKEQGLLFGDDADNDVGAITYSHSTNHLGFKVNTDERVRITSTGVVGINSTTPDSQFLVDAVGKGIFTTSDTLSSNDFNKGQFTVRNKAGGQGAFLDFRATSGNGIGRGVIAKIGGFNTFSGTGYDGELTFSTRQNSNNTMVERFRITADAKFGFNDSDPERTIDVKGSNCMVQLEGTGGNGRQYSLCSTDDTTGAAVGPAGQFVIYDDTSSAHRFTIKSDGNIGIGITNPGVKLDVSGAVQATSGYKTAGHPVLVYASFTDISGGSYATRVGSTGTSTLRHTQIYGGGGHIATFDGVNYRVGINTTVPATSLHVKGSGTDILKIESTDTGAQGANLILHHNPGIGNMANNDVISLIQFNGKDNSDNDTTYASIRAVATNVANNSETGDITFHTRNASDFGERLRIKSDGTVIFANKLTNNASYTSHNANFYGGNVNTGGVRIELAHSTTSVSGNTASSAFPHHLLLSNYSGNGSADNRMCSIGFDIPTTSTHANATIAYQATAAGTGDLQFHLESGNSISEKLRIKSDGSVNIGNPDGYAIWNALSSDVKVQLELRHTVGVPAGMAILEERGDSNGTNLMLGKSRGGNGVGVINSGDTLGSIKFSGADGTRQHNGAAIVAWTSGTIATGRVPTNLSFYTARDAVSAYYERLRIRSDGRIKFIEDPVQRNSGAVDNFSGDGAYMQHYVSRDGSTYRRNLDIAAVGDGTWGCSIRFSTNRDGNATSQERLRILKDGGVYLRTQSGFTNEAGNLSSGVGYDNRTRLRPYWVSETGACRFHFSATANSGISQPRFWLFTNGTNHLTGKIEIGMNQRTNSPTNARFRNHQSTWQVAMYGEGDNDGSGMRYIHQEGTQRGSTTVSTFDEYYVSSNGSSHYGTNDNQYQDGYGGWYWKMDGGSGVQAHRFHFDCYFSGGGFSTWYMYIDQ